MVKGELIMAYMSQERKKELAPAIKAVFAKYGMKGTIGVVHHSTLVVNIKSGELDMIGNFNAKMESTTHFGQPIEYRAKDYIDVNPYHYKNAFTGSALAFLNELFDAMNNGNWNKSDIMTDYFNVGWYVEVNIGKYDAPYVWAKG